MIPAYRASSVVLLILFGLTGALACVQHVHHGLMASGQAPEARPVTFNRDVAPIVFERCAGCHRPGEAGPFPLLTYEDVRRRARQIAEVTRDRYMPPWLPDRPERGSFVGERHLTGEQIETLQRWVREGSVEGDPADLPPMPVWTEGWQLGAPDLVVRMDEEYEVPADGRDIFRKFVLDVPLDRSRYVRAIEFRPGNPRVVHHAIIKVDPTRQTRMLERLEEGPGYGGMIFIEAESPDGHFLGWSPGKVAQPGPDDMAWRLEPGTDLVVQLHLQPTGRVETVRSSVGLFFTDRVPARTPFGLQLGSYTIDIPPGDPDHVVEDHYTLPVDLEVHSVYPHAHYLGKEVQAFATLPDGTRQWLIRIPRWDFNWQDEYRYVSPRRLPAGTTLTMRYTYDNSADNPRNPHSPPRRVVYGGESTDEMGNLWMQVVPQRPEDLETLRADVEVRAAIRYIEGYRRLLEASPDDAALHGAIGASYVRVGQLSEAVRHLQRSVGLQPADATVHYNLAGALAAQGDVPGAAHHFERAARIEPEFAEAHNNLGVMLQVQGRFDEAAARYRRALEARADYPEAHNNLGVMLQAAGRLDEAIAHFREALRLDPGYALARENLEDALRERQQRY